NAVSREKQQAGETAALKAQLSQTQTQWQAAQTELRQTQARLLALQHRVDAQAGESEALKAQLGQTQTQWQTVQTQLRQAQTRVQALTQTPPSEALVALKAQLSQAQAQQQAAQTRLEHVQSTLGTQLTRAEQEKAQLMTELSQAKADAARYPLTLANTQQALHQAEGALKDTEGTLNAQLAEVQQKNAALQVQLRQAQARPPETPLRHEEDRMAYAAGQNYARMLGRSLATQQSVGLTLRRDPLLAGLMDGLHHRNQLAADEMNTLTTTLDARLNSHLQQQQKQQQADSAAQAKAGAAFYARFAREKGVQTVPNEKALYQVNNPGQGGHITESDTVDILLTGRLPDNTVFDNAGITGRLQRVRADAILPALTYGLTHVGKGGRVHVVIPPEEGFGRAGVPPSIPGNATLIFDIQVKDIHPGKPVP
ncbi:TPA: FKBP-type peptidyl-prolyl cis-trans isomerase, partial [Yersinia enterocolitica]